MSGPSRPDPMGARQLPLALEWAPALGAADFVVADANREAHARVTGWPAGWPGRLLVLHGPPGSGKSHLLSIWRARSGAAALSVAGLEPGAGAPRPGAAPVLALDEADRVAGHEAAERALFHLINTIGQDAGWLLLAARSPPARWPVRLPDLASRLRAAPLVALGEPDDALLAQLLVKLLADRRLEAGPEVLAFLVPRMERSGDAARRLVSRLDRASLVGRRRTVTVPLARAVLRSGEAPGADRAP